MGEPGERERDELGGAVLPWASRCYLQLTQGSLSL